MFNLKKLGKKLEIYFNSLDRVQTQEEIIEIKIMPIQTRFIMENELTNIMLWAEEIFNHTKF